MKLITRKEWNARPPKGDYINLASTRGVKVHYTGGHEDPGMLDRHILCVNRVRAIQNFHMDGNGWLDIGYSMLACVHGWVFLGRGPGHLPAANGPGLNSGHYAICALIGNSGLTKPTDDLLLAIHDARDHLREHGHAADEIKRHKDGYATDCPGALLSSWVAAGASKPAVIIVQDDEDAPEWPGRYFEYEDGQKTRLMHGRDVSRWQQQMKLRGYTLDVDGFYGPLSRNICTSFQTHRGLLRDGIVGKKTWDASFAPAK